ncbi:MAG: dTMP kinase [Nitrospirota bacterium]|nr:dTMP kinase [Nitrospirota bacterium]
MSYPGFFITFEGIDGCGKTTQLSVLADHLCGLGIAVTTTREPGGTAIGTRIREILLHRDNVHLSASAELLLYGADRAQHVAEVIIPALSRGDVILCDRFSDATIAYQGSGRKLPMETIEGIIGYAAQGIAPDLTLLLDVDVTVGQQRAHRRGVPAGASDDRFEREKIDFHERVREAYLALARREPQRIRVIDASPSPEAITREVQSVVMDALAARGFAFTV